MRVEQAGFDTALARLTALRETKLGFVAANAMARSFKGDVLDYVEAGHSFTNRNKHQKHIHWRPDSGGASVYIKARHLVWMEEGTGAHDISPKARRGKKAVRFKGDGGYLVRKRVHHPGTMPMPFFFAEVEARLQRAREAGVAAVTAKTQAQPQG